MAGIFKALLSGVRDNTTQSVIARDALPTSWRFFLECKKHEVGQQPNAPSEAKGTAQPPSELVGGD